MLTPKRLKSLISVKSIPYFCELDGSDDLLHCCFTKRLKICCEDWSCAQKCCTTQYCMYCNVPCTRNTFTLVLYLHQLTFLSVFVDKAPLGYTQCCRFNLHFSMGVFILSLVCPKQAQAHSILWARLAPICKQALALHIDRQINISQNFHLCCFQGRYVHIQRARVHQPGTTWR